MSENDIRNILMSRPELEAKKMILMHEIARTNDPSLRKHYDEIENKIILINSWLNLLTYDERFVVEKHLIDQIEWPRIALAFELEWKGQFTRTERTLERYQASAIKKICEFMNTNGI